MKIQYKSFPNGLDDIAIYLGLNPAKTLFMHSTSFDQNDPKYIARKKITGGKMLYAEILSYVSNKPNGAKAAICYYNDDYLNYYHEIGFLNKDNIIKVYDGNEITFPYNSVSMMLNKKLKEDDGFRKQLEGYTIVSSYLSEEDVESAKLVNGKVLMIPYEQEKFNSKHFFRTLGKKHNFSIVPGLEFKGLENFDMTEIKKNYPNSNIWIKLDAQSSGSGNLFFENVGNLSEQYVKDQIREIGLKLYDDDYIQKNMPFILELDLASLENAEIVENIGINAVITPDLVTILGGTSQTVKDGKYIGSCVSESTYEYVDVAAKASEEAFAAIGSAGYYGFMTIDMLVVKQNDEIKAYAIDPNARFSAGTMLLKNIHLADVKNNIKSYGISYTNLLCCEDNNTLEAFKKAADGLFYDKNTGFGIVPVLVNDLMPLQPNKYYLKSVLVDEKYEDALEKFEKFKEYFRR